METTVTSDAPPKRTSVMNMWRQREQELLEKKGAPKPVVVAPSPARRSFKFEEKKIENDAEQAGTTAATSTQEEVPTRPKTFKTWKRPGTFPTPAANKDSAEERDSTSNSNSKPENDSSSDRVVASWKKRSPFKPSTMKKENESDDDEDDEAKKADDENAKSGAFPSWKQKGSFNSGNRFTGQSYVNSQSGAFPSRVRGDNSWQKKHSFTPSGFNQSTNTVKAETATTTADKPTSVSANREADQNVSSAPSNELSSSTGRSTLARNKFAMMGQRHAARPKKLANYTMYQQQPKPVTTNPLSPVSMNSAALSEAFDDTVPAEQGDKLSAELSSRRRAPFTDDAIPSEYASLQVSDSSSIPHDVNQRRVDVDGNHKDDDSMISGLSSPGSSMRTPRKIPQNAGSYNAPETSNQASGKSSSNTAAAGKSSRQKSNLDQVSEAVITDEFVAESDNNVSAFQNAVQKMSLADLAFDIRNEATAVFKNVDVNKLSNDFNQGVAVAHQTFSSLFQSGTTADRTDVPRTGDSPAPVKKDEAIEPSIEADAFPEALNESTAAESSAVDISAADDTVDKSFDPSVYNDGFVDFAGFPVSEFPETQAEPTPTLVAPSPIPPASAAATAPKRSLAIPNRSAPPVQEEVAIEVEYLDDSDAEEADV